MQISTVVSSLFIIAFIVGFYGRVNSIPVVEGIAIGMAIAMAVVSSSILMENSIRRFMISRKMKDKQAHKDLNESK